MWNKKQINTSYILLLDTVVEYIYINNVYKLIKKLLKQKILDNIYAIFENF